MKTNEVVLSFKRKNGLKTKITSASIAYDVLKPFYEDIMEHRESFKLLLLNRANRTIGVFNASEGGICGTVVDNRIIAQAAILSNACAVILSHNHPSGTLKPSPEDKKITESLKKMFVILNINLLDHIILTEDSYYSFADEMIL